MVLLPMVTSLRLGTEQTSPSGSVDADHGQGTVATAADFVPVPIQSRGHALCLARHDIEPFQN